MSELPDILTPEEVAKYLRLTMQTIYRLIRTGKLPAFKAGKEYRFHRSDIERFVAYKYYPYGGAEGVKPYFFRAEVLQKYLNNQQKYYIADEAFSGRLGLRELWYDWKEGRVRRENHFVEITYRKVRLNTAPEGRSGRWELLVVLDPKEIKKINSLAEEQNHWHDHQVFHLSLPGKEIV